MEPILPLTTLVFDMPEEPVIPLAYYEEPDFINLIKQMENAQLVGRNANSGLWYPHSSPEGGADTIGYGHKLQEGERYEGLTDQQINELLVSDLRNADAYMQNALGQNYQNLSKRGMHAGVEKFFNLGPQALQKYPNFFNALVTDDWPSASREYRVGYYKEQPDGTSVYVPLERRNELLRNYFGF